MKTKIMKDGFVWVLLSYEEAKRLDQKYPDVSIYELHEDGSESLVLDGGLITSNKTYAVSSMVYESIKPNSALSVFMRTGDRSILDLHNKLMKLSDDRFMLNLLSIHVYDDGEIRFRNIKQLTSLIREFIEGEE